jgi:hypothetical protein
MKSIVAAVALLLAAGSLALANDVATRDAAPAAIIAEFSQAIPPEPPVVAELPGHQHMAKGASCCRMNKTMAPRSTQQTGAPCGCCQQAAPRTNAKTK